MNKIKTRLFRDGDSWYRVLPDGKVCIAEDITIKMRQLKGQL